MPCCAVGLRVLVSGTVYDETGEPVMGANVVTRSLDASVPFVATATTCLDGGWQVSVPEGANVEIVASKVGWSERRRVGSFQQLARGRRNVVDFGVGRGRAFNEEDQVGAAYYLTDRPELELLAPEPGQADVDPATITIRIRTSEVLDPASRAALANALAVWPTDEGAEAAVRSGSAFLGRLAVATWDEAGTELTLRLDAPLRAGREQPRRFEVGLLAGQEPIRDGSGLPLGTGPSGEPGTTPRPGEFVAYPFRLRPWTQDPLPVDAGHRWAATHASTVGFTTTPDAVPPTLTGVFAYDAGGDAVVALRFSEPMAAFDGTPDGWSDPTIFGLAADRPTEVASVFTRRYTFALADREADLVTRRMNGLAGREPVFDPRAGGPAPLGTEFALAPDAVRVDRDLAAAMPGQVVVGVGPEDPHVVTFTIKGRAGLFGGAAGIVARAAEVADPAGNAIMHADADRHVVRAKL